MALWISEYVSQSPLQFPTDRMMRSVETSIYGVSTVIATKPIRTGVVDVPVRTILVQANTEPSLLGLCWAQPRISEANRLAKHIQIESSQTERHIL